jgi:hypothetical protein
MKKHIIISIILFNLFLSFQSNSTEFKVPNANDFSKSYVPDELLTEFKVPLEDYLYLLAHSSGYKYESGEMKSKCEPIKVPFHTNRHSLLSIGELKTVHDHLEQLGLIIPKKYNIEIHVSKKSIKLSCII